ncbi:TetR-like C-terminal domain-containing protein [Brevibacillus parabrevis]|uniref:TetR-like C-terminal domain-containing protein n=1 Tax=Brevibacillus parabrevis TaxID=54914 RepID=UPI0028D67653|nr:TetR-like C-terminal domain-containing protein [Brevibacillus parabrevis]
MRDYLIDEVKKEVNVAEGKNQGFDQGVIIQFVASALVGLVEWWFANNRPVSQKVLAEQMGRLLERNL